MRKLNITKQEENQESVVNKTVSKKQPKKLLEHVECIIDLVEKSGLSKEFFEKARNSIKYVSKKMKLTPNQTVLLSVLIEKSDDSRIYLNEISKFIGCRNIITISMLNDMEVLEKRRLIRCCKSDDKPSYRVPHEVIQSFKQNICYQPTSTLNLTEKELFRHIYNLFIERENKEISCTSLIEELRSLLNDNPTLSFCKQIKQYDKEKIIDDNFILLLLFCHRFINLDDDCISFYDFEDLYEDRWTAKEIKSSLEDGYNALLRRNIIEYNHDKGYREKEHYKITTKEKEKLFAGLDIKIQQAENKKDLILHTAIQPKQLFYNQQEQTQIEMLSSLLEKENFLSVQKKLENAGMRKGFACLFYGAPGTGKTETVYQLAHATGRDILMVDIAETKSMWYGESEKKIKEIFTKYRAYLQTSEIAPILLFNEADAIIGKRKETGKNSSIDQTENAMQNILLQEIENLEGILIATTNLTQNLDDAFERRFLYKIEFQKPDVSAKEKIWQTMLPSLTAEEQTELALHYNFSGGEIENIVRKYTIDTILNGVTPSIKIIHSYCQNEFLHKNKEHKRVGFLQSQHTFY